jgi:Xaa-Pro aminopeptidase
MYEFMEVKDKILALRQLMKKYSLDAYIIPSTDPHLGEYVPDFWKCIAWFSGFTGSAGTIVITSDFAGLWTDSRYFLQAEEQLKKTGIKLVKLKIPHTPEYIDWLKENIKSGSVIGFDGKVMSINLSRRIEKILQDKNIHIDASKDLIGEIWHPRPPIPDSEIFDYDIKFAGVTRVKKIENVRQQMKENHVDYHLLTALDDVAWTFNIRAFDVKYSPLAVCYGLIGQNNIFLFADNKKIPDKLSQILLNEGILLCPYKEISDKLKKLRKGTKIYLSPDITNTWLYRAIPAHCEIIEGISIPTKLKAIKNSVEIKHIRNTMIKDGVALTRFFYWLEKNIGKQKITEISASEKLNDFRNQQKYYQCPSFATIAGYREHGAIVHYEPSPVTDVELKAEGIFLLDSGGQYLDGTTDTTRTVSFGNTTPEEKFDFTLALKGTIGLSMLEFPLRTKGYQIEVLARKAFWEHGLDYGHGTGHGVGFFLNVHEGPQTIGSSASGNLEVILKPGMLVSDEPGIYRVGKYGIRTENILLIVNSRETEFGQFLKFETITLCYIDSNLIEVSMLISEERVWLNSYHKKVYDQISPYLSTEEKKWLKEKTKEI